MVKTTTKMGTKRAAKVSKTGATETKAPVTQLSEASDMVGAVSLKKSMTSCAPTDSINGTNGQQCTVEVHNSSPDLRFVDPQIRTIMQVWRYRQIYHGQEKSCVLRIKAILRRDFCDGDKKAAEVLYGQLDSNADAKMAVFSLLQVRDILKKERTNREKIIELETKKLPIAEWTKGVRGFGIKGLGYIIGECGDLSKYPTIQGVYKRMGVGVIDGERQHKCTDTDKALKHGYNPRRRSTLWSLAESLLKGQGKEDKALFYRIIYDNKKLEERPKVESDQHAHRRAMRYMSKMLLKDLTIAWRTLNENQPTTGA